MAKFRRIWTHWIYWIVCRSRLNIQLLDLLMLMLLLHVCADKNKRILKYFVDALGSESGYGWVCTRESRDYCVHLPFILSLSLSLSSSYTHAYLGRWPTYIKLEKVSKYFLFNKMRKKWTTILFIWFESQKMFSIWLYSCLLLKGNISLMYRLQKLVMFTIRGLRSHDR